MRPTNPASRTASPMSISRSTARRRLYRFADSDEDQPWPAVNLPRLHTNADRFAAVHAVAMTGFSGLQSIEPGQRKILVARNQFTDVK